MLSSAALERLALYTSPYIALYALPIICCAWVAYMRLFHPLAGIPGPFWASLSRTWLAFHVYRGHIDTLQRDLHDKLGDIVRIAPDEVSISDPEAIKIIYGIKSGFVKTDFYDEFQAMKPHRDHFSRRDEKVHADRRRYVNNLYSMTTILESEQCIDSCSEVFLPKMAKHADQCTVVDLGEWIQWYTFDVIGELFFGERFGFLDGEHDYENTIQHLDSLFPAAAIGGVLPVYARRVLQLFGPLAPSIRAGITCFENIRKRAAAAVQGRLAEVEAGNRGGRADMLDKLISLLQVKPGWVVMDINSEVCSALLAGSDTTAIAIRAVLYYLMKTPAAMETLVDEILAASASGKLSPSIRYAEAIELPYLVACIKEGLRIHPSVGMSLPRHVPPGGATISGRFFPGGTRVGINAAVVHFDKNVFGDDALQFVPERWLQGEASVKMERYLFHFGQGARTCLGKNISLAEMYKIIPQFLRQFRVELVQPDKEWHTHDAFFNKQEGILVRLYKR
ncbi:uncharacterized protein Z520_10476 [Fonsecaea multimorphosa CBS 102226]|uniref:Cytochrome P450 oxidoreductase n=1 Tax=Fonsecaea multimorphosa CBS 102226 TaxID=1442371 RepID=A0A0D2I9K0_9EURO|nr:uncharacterized protein Z520_10476 [Fonsecaea multimorphosa CBS 102226]KIX93851.1 hypothetical protein Z520_10476 [Fonsecaea multimorphosa CBS 102226]